MCIFGWGGVATVRVLEGLVLGHVRESRSTRSTHSWRLLALLLLLLLLGRLLGLLLRRHLSQLLLRRHLLLLRGAIRRVSTARHVGCGSSGGGVGHTRGGILGHALGGVLSGHTRWCSHAGR